MLKYIVLLLAFSTISGFQGRLLKNGHFHFVPKSYLSETSQSGNRLWSTASDKLDLYQKIGKFVASSLLIVGSFGSCVAPVKAGVDPALLEKYVTVQNTLDSADIEYTELPSGVSFREFRIGRGERTVSAGKTVTAEMTIRCKKLATAKDVGGVKYFDSKVDTPEKSLTWTIGSGEFPPEVEEAMIGMKRNAIRRIEVPSVVAYRAKNNKQLPLPSKNDENGNRYFSKAFKTDATLLFEILVTKINEDN